MKLHIFNPEHDIALASNLANFTAPHAGRALRNDLGFLPALWAAEGDVVLVENAEEAQKVFKRFVASARLRCPAPRLVTKKDISSISIDGIEPWGWDAALRAQLLRYGVDERIMPTSDEIEEIRNLSHRRCAALVLHELQSDATTGCAYCCQTLDEIEKKLHQYRHIVVKAPWSSSGRGIRFVCDSFPESMQRWVLNVIRAQGSVMVEPYYKKIKDFGMEFFSDGKGNIEYLGLSLFHAANGAYVGNILATEPVKEEMINHYVPMKTLKCIQEKIKLLTGRLYKGKYKGPFGVDMMVVEGKEGRGFLLHPCVEINLRRTMGHVALSLSPEDDSVKRVMRIILEGNYKLRTRKM